MKLTYALSITAGGACLLAFTAPADEVEFRVADGATLTKTFVTSGEFALEDLVLTMNGEEVEPDMFGAGDFSLDEATAEGTITMTVVDEYVSVEDGRPTVLHRTFEEINGSFETGDGESGDEDFEDMLGKTVRFEWDDSAGEYTVSTDDEDVDEDDLAMLAEDLDMRILLPGRAVSEGDSWKLGWEELNTLAMPGFDLEKAIERDADFEDMPFDVAEQFDELFGDSGLTCTYEGMRDVDGVSVGVIALSSEFEGTLDLTDVLLTAMEESGDMEGMSPDLEVVFDLSMEIEGELLWNPRAGHAHSMAFEAEFAVNIVGSMYMDMQGMGEFDMGGEAEMSGAVSRAVSVEG